MLRLPIAATTGLTLLAIATAPSALADAQNLGDGKIVAQAEIATPPADSPSQPDSAAEAQIEFPSDQRGTRTVGKPRPRPDWLIWTREEYAALTSRLPECAGTTAPEPWCAYQEPTPPNPANPTAPAAAPAPPSRQMIEAIVRQVATSLQLPTPNPKVGPDPSWNEWDMAVVGMPLWLWTDTPTTMHSTNTDYGLTVTLNARQTKTTFTMGDKTTLTCRTTKPYVRTQVKPDEPSPVCGHTYTWPAPGGTDKKAGTYQVTATSHWTIDWTAAGYSGTLTTTMHDSRDLPVGELHALTTRR